jgi:membrane associated rhomboid family serine protease
MTDPYSGGAAMQFPRPGKVLRGVMWTVAVLAIVGAIAFHWSWGQVAFSYLVFEPDRFLHFQFWRLFTAGLLTSPVADGLSHLTFTLIGLYFLSPDLERRWGGTRFGVFLASCVVSGFLLATAVDALPFGGEALHAKVMFGMGAAITGTAVAWSRENAGLQVRLMFILPIKGSQLLWLTIAFCVLQVIFGAPGTEGLVAPFGGILAGLAFAGSPSPLRAMYLRWKLGTMRRKTGLSAAAMLEPNVVRRRPGGPPLRVVQGGLEDDSPKQPPRDKRYLN